MTREQDEESYLAICRRAPPQRSNGTHGAAACSAYVTKFVLFACLHLKSSHAPLQGGMTYEEEDACMSYEEEDTCPLARGRKTGQWRFDAWAFGSNLQESSVFSPIMCRWRIGAANASTFASL